jgi:hypothetical protein
VLLGFVKLVVWVLDVDVVVLVWVCVVVVSNEFETL